MEQVAEIPEQFRQDGTIHAIYASHRTRAVEDLRADLSYVVAGMLSQKEFAACSGCAQKTGHRLRQRNSLANLFLACGFISSQDLILFCVMLSGARERYFWIIGPWREVETSRECMSREMPHQGVLPRQYGQNSLTQHTKGSRAGIFRLRAHQ